jgi:hypothetical protein
VLTPLLQESEEEKEEELKDKTNKKNADTDEEEDEDKDADGGEDFEKNELKANAKKPVPQRRSTRNSDAEGPAFESVTIFITIYVTGQQEPAREPAKRQGVPDGMGDTSSEDSALHLIASSPHFRLCRNPRRRRTRTRLWPTHHLSPRASSRS